MGLVGWLVQTSMSLMILRSWGFCSRSFIESRDSRSKRFSRLAWGLQLEVEWMTDGLGIVAIGDRDYSLSKLGCKPNMGLADCGVWRWYANVGTCKTICFVSRDNGCIYIFLSRVREYLYLEEPVWVMVWFQHQWVVPSLSEGELGILLGVSSICSRFVVLEEWFIGIFSSSMWDHSGWVSVV